MPHAVQSNALLVRSQVFSTSGVDYDKLVVLPRDFYFVVGLGSAPEGVLFLAHRPEEHWVSARPDGGLLASLASASANQRVVKRALDADADGKRPRVGPWGCTPPQHCTPNPNAATASSCCSELPSFLPRSVLPSIREGTI